MRGRGLVNPKREVRVIPKVLDEPLNILFVCFQQQNARSRLMASLLCDFFFIFSCYTNEDVALCTNAGELFFYIFLRDKLIHGCIYCFINDIIVC